MNLHWNPTTILCSELTLALAATICLTTTRCHATESMTVQSDGTHAALGIKSYEVSTEDVCGINDASWFCQVVGRASVAGSIAVAVSTECTTAVVRHAKTGAEVTVTLLDDHSMFISRAGVQVASLIHTPAGSGLPATGSGFSTLAADPGWQLLLSAIEDSNLRTTIGDDGTTPSPGCGPLCAEQWPTPSNCAGVHNEIYCCQVRVERTYCESVCRCESAANPNLCRTLAGTARLFGELECSLHELELWP